MATVLILSWTGWQGVATDMQNIRVVEHRCGHCHNTILACMAGGGHCHAKYHGGGYRGQLLLWSCVAGVATAVYNIMEVEHMATVKIYISYQNHK